MLKSSLIESDNQKVGVRVAAIDGSERTDMVHMIEIRRIISLVGGAYFLFMTAWVVPVACVITVSMLFPLMLFSMPMFNYLEHKLCGMVNAHWNAVAVFCGASVTEYGTNLANYAEEKCLLLANHLGLLDHFVLMQSLNEKGSIRSKWMWVIYNIWKYTPLGVMWTSHGNFFVNGGASKRDSVLNSFRQHLTNSFYKYDFGWVIMYPEGSRLYLVKKSGRSFAEKNGLKPLDHCVYPRTGAAHAVLDVLGPIDETLSSSKCGKGEPIKYIIDATIGYHRGVVPDICDAVMGDWPSIDASAFAVHYEVIPVKPEWSEENKLRDFLYERYVIKDKLLADFYKTGNFPGEQTKVMPNNYEMFFAQIFWGTLYYAHYLYWLRPLMVYAWASLLSMFY
uniref:PlsC domain-containing protein n=1 Tax=Caenorhabditis tropicalis TaxID=1561998 RepID=A0A1I7TWF0_9PELO